MTAAQVGPMRASSTTLVIPLMALAVSIELENLKIQTISLIGIALVMIGGWVANRVSGERDPNPVL